MRKIIILLLCCVVLISMVGCGGNAAPPPNERPSATASETVITETPSVTVVKPTEKEKEPIPTESKEQATKLTATIPITTKKVTEETKNSEMPNASKEKENSQTIETTASTTPQPTERTTTESEPLTETIPSEFDIHYWITFAKEYAVSVGLILDSTAVDCWDNPIRAGTHCIYLERDIQNRLNRYVKDEDITDVWIWAEHSGNDCYDIYVGYA